MIAPYTPHPSLPAPRDDEVSFGGADNHHALTVDRKRTDGTKALPACSNTQWDRFSIDRNHLWGNTHFASSIALAGWPAS